AIEPSEARVPGSKTCTVLAPAHEIKARSGVPAKTTSAGASSVSIVATIRIRLKSITLTESEIRFTTHTSLVVRNRAVTGSRPVATLPTQTGAPELTSKTSSRASGRLHTARRLPSGLRATGCTGGVSKLTNEFVDAADTAILQHRQVAAETRDIVPLNS